MASDAVAFMVVDVVERRAADIWTDSMAYPRNGRSLVSTAPRESVAVQLGTDATPANLTE